MSDKRGVLAVPALAELLEHPERARDLPAQVARDLLPRVVGLQTVLLACALVNRDGDAAGDHLLTVAEASQKLGQSTVWLYKHAAELPFTVRNGRALRFSAAGIDKWIRHQQRR